MAALNDIPDKDMDLGMLWQTIPTPPVAPRRGQYRPNKERLPLNTERRLGICKCPPNTSSSPSSAVVSIQFHSVLCVAIVVYSDPVYVDGLLSGPLWYSPSDVAMINQIPFHLPLILWYCYALDSNPFS